MRTFGWVAALGLIVGCGRPPAPDVPHPAVDDRPAPDVPPPVGDGPPAREPVAAAKLTPEHASELVPIVRAYLKSMEATTRFEETRLVLDLTPTNAELAHAFPRHVEPAQELFTHVRKQIPIYLATGGQRDLFTVTKVEIKDARLGWMREHEATRKLLAVLNPAVPIADPHLWTVEEGEKLFLPFIRVNGRWVLLGEFRDLADHLTCQGM
jgi:hypothetical protein